ncbi:GNAT family N-acetyltransferase [Tissierella sp.]|uniref:GNAT family N-acetyltransferase n=1 Tax=Tissierella sp. TaxID=41274 RepID=UPI002865078F|nr:GNAT family N-acetyltransferase [Tissierella sp.]MDR7855067.1 GNAT family N-acetyltransferase [Tissierella sp.]
MGAISVSKIIVKEVANDIDIKEFVNLPFRLYSKDEPWVPPITSDFKKYIIGVGNYLNQSGPNTRILAYDNDKVVGRLLVGINEHINHAKGFKEGYISLFECIKDKEVAFLMLDFAESWLSERGMTLIKGPLSLPGGDDCRGFIIDNFTDATSVMNTYNKKYYNDYFEEYGFEKYLDCYAYKSDIHNDNISRYEKLVPYAMKKHKYRVDRIDLKNIDKEIKDVKSIIERAMPAEWDDFIPPNDEELELIKKQIVPLADPDLIYIARTEEGEPIGFNISIPDYNQVLSKLKGKLLPFGIFKFLYYKRKIDAIRFFVLFVVPEYRLKGVSSAIYLKSYIAALDKGYKFVEGSTIWEYNDPMIIDIEKYGGVRYKTYRIYKKEI